MISLAPFAMVSPPSATLALRWTEVVAALAVAQSTLELLYTRRALSDGGTWRWATLAREMPLLRPLLAYRPFIALLLVRLTCALLLLAGVRGPVAATLWLSSLLVNVRFRGSSNGGSDMMQMVVLTGLVVAHAGASSPPVASAGIVYIAAQSTMSYFIAGVVKLLNAPWRRGIAMTSFVSTPHFGTPPMLRHLLSRRNSALAVSWAVILFECAFPLALLSPVAAFAMVTVALCFHLGNVAAFGLNRFLLAWAASWPAVLYASSLVR